MAESQGTLELRLAETTRELQAVRETLSREEQERAQAEDRIRQYQSDLRRMGLELSLTEERERRAIASDLHDLIGQALALIKMRLVRLQGNAIFSGHDQDIAEIRKLLDQAIAYTRNLTFEISPPLLYELGLAAALEWLAEETGKKNKLVTAVTASGDPQGLPGEINVVIFKAVRELLINAVKHARARKIEIHLDWKPQSITVTVRDDGVGFQPSGMDLRARAQGGFGLFSIKERAECLGGRFSIASQAPRGTQVSLTLPTQSGVEVQVDGDPGPAGR